MMKDLETRSDVKRELLRFNEGKVDSRLHCRNIWSQEQRTRDTDENFRESDVGLLLKKGGGHFLNAEVTQRPDSSRMRSLQCQRCSSTIRGTQDVSKIEGKKTL